MPLSTGSALAQSDSPESSSPVKTRTYSWLTEGGASADDFDMWSDKPMESPKVYLVIDDKKFHIGMLVGKIETIERQSYSSYNIPENADLAGKSPSLAHDNFVYVIVNEKEAIVMWANGSKKPYQYYLLQRVALG